MLRWLARKLAGRLTSADLLGRLRREDFLEAMKSENVKTADLLAELAARLDFTGFVAWRHKTDGHDDDWQWFASGMSQQEIMYQLEHAAERIITAVEQERKHGEVDAS